MRNYGDKNRVSKNTMRERMMNTFDEDSTFKWDFKGYKPDLIVINLGSNDFSTNPHPLREEFLAYSEILLRLRGVYGVMFLFFVLLRLRVLRLILSGFCTGF